MSYIFFGTIAAVHHSRWVHSYMAHRADFGGLGMTRIGIVGMYISQHETIPCSISIIDLPVMYACIRFLKFRVCMTPTAELGRSGGSTLSLG